VDRRREADGSVLVGGTGSTLPIDAKVARIPVALPGGAAAGGGAGNGTAPTHPGTPTGTSTLAPRVTLAWARHSAPARSRR
jgi:hypothetical protein